MILETLITTNNETGDRHIAAMGPRFEGSDFAKEGLQKMVLRPYPETRTLKNLLTMGVGVVHITDNVFNIVRAALNREKSKEDKEFNRQLAETIEQTCCRYASFRVIHSNVESMPPQLYCQLNHWTRNRDFIGFNRAKNAIIEMAILVTRVRFLPKSEIDEAIVKSKIIVDKTGAEQEMQSYEFLIDYLNDYYQNETGQADLPD